MSLPNAKVGGTFGYNMNVQFPIGAGNMGGAFTAMDTVAATIYPEPKDGNVFLAVNSASATAIAFYYSTWQSVTQGT